MTSRERAEADATRGSSLAPSPGLEEYATIQTVADALDVHYNTVYRAVRDGRLPCVRLGRAVRIKVSDLERLREDLAPAAAPVRHRPPRPRAPRGEFARRARGIE